MEMSDVNTPPPQKNMSMHATCISKFISTNRKFKKIITYDNIQTQSFHVNGLLLTCLVIYLNVLRWHIFQLVLTI